MAAIIDLPDFMFKGKKISYSKFEKIYITIFGLFIGFIHKNTNKKLFCFILNFFFSKDGKIFYHEKFYGKKMWNNNILYFPNKRIDRVILDHKNHLKLIFDTYCLDEIDFNLGDNVIDCGANVGELLFSLKLNNIDCNYIGFEPDPANFKALEKNTKPFNVSIYENALSYVDEKRMFYLNTEGGDSSLIYFGDEKSIELNTKTLDSFKYNKIKLLKIEAEGAELEVLQGSTNTLKNVEYITVDYGPERGITNDPTSAEIIDFLYQNNFRMIKASRHRDVGLFKNTTF
tara:strand:- start:39018 stop:39878 length:861 start_codon:yes stop_codon:yes gene_type:complete